MAGPTTEPATADEASLNEALAGRTVVPWTSYPRRWVEAMRLTQEAGPRGIDLLGDVELSVTVELGRTRMLVEDVLKLRSGSVIELDKLAGDPVDVCVNGRLVARGEVLVLNDNFCIRISEIVADLEEQAPTVGDDESAAAA